MTQRHHKNTVRDGYNRIAKAYLENRTRDSEDIQLLDEFMQQLPDGAAVLDAGCGAGVPVAKTLSTRFRVTGVDFAQAQIDLARQHIPEADFVCADMTELDFPQESFDAICSYYAIIHIPREHHESILQSFYRLLKPSGLALLCLGANDIEEDIDEDYLGTRMYWSHFDRVTYLAMLKRCGFEIVWSRIVVDASYPEGPGHLFVLVKRK